MARMSLLVLVSIAATVYAAPVVPRDDPPKKDDSFFLSFISTILITILAAGILIVFYRYAVKYIPSNTIRIPLKVFSSVGPDGMIRLPTSDEEEAHIGETFSSNSDEDHQQPFHDDEPHESPFHDEDDDIPPAVPLPKRTVKLQENEQDFFDVSDDDDDEEVRPAGQDEGTKAWRD